MRFYKVLLLVVLVPVGCSKPTPVPKKPVLQVDLENSTSADVPKLRELLSDESTENPHRVAHALGKLGPQAKDAVSELIAALKNSESRVRMAAAHALWKIGPEAEAAVPALVEAMKDKDNEVYLIAVAALGGIKANSDPTVVFRSEWATADCPGSRFFPGRRQP